MPLLLLKRCCGCEFDITFRGDFCLGTMDHSTIYCVFVCVRETDQDGPLTCTVNARRTMVGAPLLDAVNVSSQCFDPYTLYEKQAETGTHTLFPSLCFYVPVWDQLKCLPSLTSQQKYASVYF